MISLLLLDMLSFFLLTVQRYFKAYRHTVQFDVKMADSGSRFSFTYLTASVPRAIYA